MIVCGGGKIGANVASSLLDMGHEVTLVEQRRDRFERLEEKFGPVAMRGDATEIHVLERAGIDRPPDILFAVTGDDEDNIIIAQMAREGYGVPEVIARVNDPRNQQHFDRPGITQTVCATSGILGLVEHEMPEHGLVKLLELRQEGLEVVEMQISGGSPAAGKSVGALTLPDGARLVSVTRNGVGEIAVGETMIMAGRPGDRDPQAGPGGSSPPSPGRRTPFPVRRRPAALVVLLVLPAADRLCVRLGDPAADGRAPSRPRRFGAPEPCPGGLRSRPAGDDVRRRAGRARAPSSRAASPAAAVPRRPRKDRLPAASRACSASRSHPTTRRAASSCVDYTDTNGDTRVVRVPVGRGVGAAGERAPAALRRPAVLEPQRRHARLWPRRPPVRRHGGRRLRR